MPNNKIYEYSEHLSSLARDLDISPSDYKKAVKRYEALAEYLNEAEYEGAVNGVSIYPQGSFELGTVIRPIKDTEDSGYDIDLVCETNIPTISTSPGDIKNAIGDKIKESPRYNRMLGEEGKRCWKLEYDEDDGFDFHMDVLPSKRETAERINQLKTQTDYPELVDTSIAITNKEDMGTYRWSTSNPRGFSNWFGMMNNSSFLTIASKAKQELYENNQKIFASVDEVPDQLIRTPLQKAIQILKRHRDVYFAGHEIEEYKPISIIITTLAAYMYNNEDNVYDALKNIIINLRQYLPLVDRKSPLVSEKIIQRQGNEIWYIRNPVDREENFADRWHEDNDARAKAFFQWASVVSTDLIDIVSNNDFDSIVYSTALNLKGSNLNLSQKAPTIISKPIIDIKKPNKPWCNSDTLCLKKL